MFNILQKKKKTVKKEKRKKKRHKIKYTQMIKPIHSSIHSESKMYEKVIKIITYNLN